MRSAERLPRPAAAPAIVVARPRLPDTAALVPYLREIDANRWYTNHGPLADRLEARLATRFGVPADGVTLTASATAGLAVTIAAAARAGGRYCAVPGWTFAGTAHAVRNAGFIPWFVDIDARRWALTPDCLRAALSDAPGPVAAAVPVVPFGAPFDLGAWEEFQADTGVPVVVDAAAAVDTLRPARVPAVISLHATKALGVGEGAAVVCHDPALVQRARQAANFGFYGARIAEIAGTNAKMSEYHAAVGLAALDGWEQTRAGFMKVAGYYRTHLKPLRGVALQEDFGTEWISSTCLVTVAASREAVAASLAQAGIETRAWWGDGPAGHPAFRDCPRMPLLQTAGLAAHVLGLPFAVDLTEAEVRRVATALTLTLRSPARAGARSAL